MSEPVTVEHVAKELANNRSQIAQDNKNLMEALALACAQNRADIRANQERTDKELSNVRAQIQTIMDNCNDKQATTGPTYAQTAATEVVAKHVAVSRAAEHDQKQYWWARRCMVFFPIYGETDDEMMANLEGFVREKLRVPTTELETKDISSIRRLQLTRGRQPRGELIVVFADVNTRDRVASYARNLADFVDKDKKPTAGIRLEVPTHLM